MTGTPASRAAAIAPFLDDKTLAVIRLDLAAIDADQLVAKYAGDAPGPGGVPAEESRALAEKIKEGQKYVQEVYVVMSFSDIPVYEPFSVVKLRPGADPRQVYALLNHESAEAAIDEEEYGKRSFLKDDMLVLGNNRAVLRFKLNATPAVAPNLESAFALAGETHAQALLVPTEEARAELRRLVGELPPEAGFDGQALVNGLSYAACGVRALPTFEFRLDAHCADASQAQQIHSTLTGLFDNLRAFPLPPEMAGLIDAFLPQLQGERISIALREGDPAFEQIKTQSIQSVFAAREAATRLQVSNNLKQIALAMHQHEQVSRAFPPAASPSGLSWRVHLLPYLEEQELYSQFNLNEPWDSPTNKPLIERIPLVFQHPTARVSAPGMTVFVAPVGDKTIFPPGRATRIPDITDGLSNTILVLEANAENAVVWTRPDDWEFNDGNPTAGLGGLWSNGVVHVARADGSVVPIVPNNDPENFSRAIMRNDNQLVQWASLAPQRSATGGGFPFPLAGGGGPFGPPMGPGGRPAIDAFPGGPVPPGFDPQNPGGVPPGINDPHQPGIPGEMVDSPYIAEAKKAFAAGQDKLAFDYLYAEAIAGEDRDNLRGSLLWAAALKRPVLAIRWGIGVQYNAPRAYSGGPAPIGRVPAPGSFQPGNQGQPGGDPSAPQADAKPDAIVDYFTAELGTKILEGLRQRIEEGQFGEVQKFYGEAAADPYGAFQQDPAGVAARAIAGKPLAIQPGLVFVGVGPGGAQGQKELLTRAKTEDLDALIIFEVAVSPSRTMVTNNTKVMLFDLAKAEAALHTSKILKNTAVEVARQQNRGEDPVDDVIEKLFEAVDGAYVLADLPEVLNETNVTARVMKLAESSPDNKLATLAEIAFWQSKGLVSAENAQVAYEKILGPDGEKLFGPLEDRKAAIAPLLPKTPGAGGGGRTLPGRRLGIGTR